jgi:prepilin signal peptidase PulO-like enzyme (type II secretory pathway)
MAVPFGPFLATGALVALWWGPAMVGWYLDSFAL